MQKKAPDKFHSGYGNRYDFVFFSIFGVKGHLALMNFSDTAVSDSYSMGVASKIFEHVIGSFNRFPYTDNPLVGVEFFFEGLIITAEANLTTANGPCQLINELAAKDN